ncbi:DUF6194 family protein [Flavobacteriaceae bacterium GF1]
MTVPELEDWILNNYSDIVVTNTYGERSFFYNPSGLLPKGIYFTTIKESDGPNDKASHLDRNGTYRISIGIGKSRYQKLFGATPKRAPKGGVVDIDFDFTSVQTLMPHPVYAWMGWVAMNNPSKNQLKTLENLLDIAYGNVLKKFEKRKRTS